MKSIEMLNHHRAVHGMHLALKYYATLHCKNSTRQRENVRTELNIRANERWRKENESKMHSAIVAHAFEESKLIQPEDSFSMSRESTLTKVALPNTTGFTEEFIF
jgi:hypothetical protein